MRLEHSCVIFGRLSESEQREFFIKYKKKRDDDITTYINSRIKKPRKQTTENTVKFTSNSTKMSNEEKLLLKKLGVNLTALKDLLGD